MALYRHLVVEQNKNPSRSKVYSVPRIDFKEIPSPTFESQDRDLFEKFCREFLIEILGFTIISDPCRGADGGIDIKAQSPIGENILISCKHYAHGGRSVGRADEQDIVDRLHEHGCVKFYGFYSTIASSGLKDKLDRLKGLGKVDFDIWDSEKIERHLLEETKGYQLAKRFFPVSVENSQPRIISLIETYKEDDAIKTGSHWYIPMGDGFPGTICPSPAEAAKQANEMSMIEFHRPQFLKAWKDAVRLFPDYFSIPLAGIDSAERPQELMPMWERFSEDSTLRPMERWFVLAVWSFVDSFKVREILKSIGRDASQQSLDLMSISFHAATGTTRRDILARLLAYAPPGF